MKTIIAGSRSITDYQLLLSVIRNCNIGITEVISGTARGVDKLGERYAQQHGLLCTQFPAPWAEMGNRAGPIRNEQMAEYADACIVLWDGHSRGSQDMVKRAMQHRLLLHVTTHRMSAEAVSAPQPLGIYPPESPHRTLEVLRSPVYNV